MTMSSMDMLDVGQANEFKLAARRNGFTPTDLKKLCEGDILAQVRQVLLGHAEIVEHVYTIDCDAQPIVPEGWIVEEHKTGGQVVWNPHDFVLYLSPKQQGDKSIEGNKLRNELVDKLVLNSNVLDFLLANTHLIPKEWKGKIVFFWGTVYRNQGDDLRVRYLYWNGSHWDWSAAWLDDRWDGTNTALVCAS